MRHVELRPGIYRDSVRLMQISDALVALPGVARALVAMATGLNMELLVSMGFTPPAGMPAGPNDMLVALEVSDTALSSTLERLDAELCDVRSMPASLSAVEGASPHLVTVPARTTATALRRFGASVVLVSTPGRHAFVEAMDALDAGAHVMIFSDNVPIEQEVSLKSAAAQRGLLVMGPDCGTTVIGGVGLGFANVVRPGRVGIVAASGTGAQQAMSLLAWAGAGISACLGVGGRDLSAAVGGRSCRTALDLLDEDPATELIVVIGKPPDAAVAAAVRDHAEALDTPAIFATLGPGQPDLTAVVEKVLRRLGAEVPAPWPRWLPTGQRPTAAHPGVLYGLFTGGTLCAEAEAIATAMLATDEVRGAVPVTPLNGGPGALRMVDLGADEYTVGRPHPMIDLGPRMEQLSRYAAEPSCAAILLDVVLGHGAHPDPAARIAPAVRAATTSRADLSVTVALIGTPDDPQHLPLQAEQLCEAGAAVFISNAEAARHAISHAIVEGH